MSNNPEELVEVRFTVSTERAVNALRTVRGLAYPPDSLTLDGMAPDEYMAATLETPSDENTVSIEELDVYAVTTSRQSATAEKAWDGLLSAYRKKRQYQQDPASLSVYEKTEANIDCPIVFFGFDDGTDITMAKDSLLPTAEWLVNRAMHDEKTPITGVPYKLFIGFVNKALGLEEPLPTTLSEAFEAEIADISPLEEFIPDLDSPFLDLAVVNRKTIGVCTGPALSRFSKERLGWPNKHVVLGAFLNRVVTIVNCNESTSRKTDEALLERGIVVIERQKTRNRVLKLGLTPEALLQATHSILGIEDRYRRRLGESHITPSGLAIATQYLNALDLSRR